MKNDVVCEEFQKQYPSNRKRKGMFFFRSGEERKEEKSTRGSHMQTKQKTYKHSGVFTGDGEKGLNKSIYHERLL